MEEERRVFAGVYKQEGGGDVYVVQLVKNAETGEQMVLYNFLNERKRRYEVMTLAGFNEYVGIRHRVRRFTRIVGSPKDRAREGELADDELHVPRSKPLELPRRYGGYFNYLHYAKDIIQNYREDHQKLIKSRRLNKLYGLTREEYDFLVREHRFLKDCLENELREYRSIVANCFVRGKSVRAYARESGLNRGVIEYRRKKLYSAYAKCLETRDRNAKSTVVRPLF